MKKTKFWSQCYCAALTGLLANQKSILVYLFNYHNSKLDDEARVNLKATCKLAASIADESSGLVVREVLES
jgi:hypothetical protein